ncbi:hypothetical protein HMPREF1979_02472 [Actinomyces johnsonii F0542]|uniref:Tat pathway signal sequence domain protein n=1 Tax=Actinomyces johnsonii F0542 TaxID=1321818 RepID=U1QL77_9ACTO|nr:hypothetical protein HMPREF1979_02472 [Actinomyces johnsonii F0542]
MSRTVAIAAMTTAAVVSVAAPAGAGLALPARFGWPQSCLTSNVLTNA